MTIYKEYFNLSSPHILLPKVYWRMDLKSFLKSVKLQESTISMFFGVLVILIVGFLLIRLFTRNTNPEIIPPIEITQEENQLPITHTVASNESLWTISEEYYGTGYNWVDIKEANNLTDADQIHKGDELTIPNVTPRVVQTDTEIAVNETQSISETNPETTIPETQQNTDRHVVERGESLWRIAERYLGDGDKWVEIAKVNNLDHPNVIYAGQELTLSSKPGGSLPSEAASTTGSSYSVQKGDSLWSIAQGTYGDGAKWTKIAQANNLSHPSIIHAGNTLMIPE